MLETESESLIGELGRIWQLTDYVVASCFDAQGNLAFALGDGKLFVVPVSGSEPWTLQVHRGACLSLAAAPGEGFLSGGDDGRFVGVSLSAEVEELASFPGRWIEHVVSHANGLIACAAGKRLHLIKADRSAVDLEHPSTAGGLSFSPNGLQIAVSHYGGVSLHYTQALKSLPKVLKWTGSHLAVTWSADGRFVLTSMQENCIRGWRLKGAEDLHMSGYDTRIKSWCWFNKGRWLATSASDCVPCWPFKKRSGPMGEPPTTLAYRDRGEVTVVAGDPNHPLIAVGYDDGLALIAELDESGVTERSVTFKPPGAGAVSCMAFAADSKSLAVGTAEGFAGIMPMAADHG
ncbi:MAG TPA: WD40 repeat domain-containing protein [Pseudomonas xinjiangensis]|uniref:WD40 repeat domain-containing protein n=2 Tax=root TaxID=1 RepID=A0A7V1BS84_9GAMM|nr:WD40 repeat domain-containing protein [Halopseudomonas xinjiangensis]HEC46979.1 WD40 repeat domain-containing protein [Halopseudomonas xinjiangensis]